MRGLLDTHTLLWHLGGDSKLGEASLNFIENKENQVFVSVASLWELAIKASLGRLELHGARTIQEFVDDKVLGYGFELLEIKINHLDRVRELPFHHRDPFDRLIIAQAMEENLTLLSKDEHFPAYDVQVLW